MQNAELKELIDELFDGMPQAIMQQLLNIYETPLDLLHNYDDVMDHFHQLELLATKVRPAVLLNDPEWAEVFRQYFTGVCIHGHSWFFFSSGESLKKFQSGWESLGESDLLNKLYGTTLGYPPVAVKYFDDEMDIFDPDRVSINYHGIEFISHMKYLDECLAWMKKNHAIPDHMQIGVKIHKTLSREDVIV